MDHDHEDGKRLWAAVQAAMAVTQARSERARLHNVCSATVIEALSGSPWQLNAALRFRPTLRIWIDKAFFYLRLRRLMKMLNDGVDESDQREKLGSLTRTLALLEFGVAVNEYWYRRLDSLVAAGAISMSDLRRMLGCIEVYANRNGDLIARGFHIGIRIVFGFSFCFWAAISGTLLCAACEQVWLHGPSSRLFWCFAYYSSWTGLPAWGMWWLGPHSWYHTKKLRRLLGHDDPSRKMGIPCDLF